MQLSLLEYIPTEEESTPLPPPPPPEPEPKPGIQVGDKVYILMPLISYIEPKGGEVREVREVRHTQKWGQAGEVVGINAVGLFMVKHGHFPPYPAAEWRLVKM